MDRFDADPVSSGRTLLEKIWSDHVVGRREDGRELLYVDRVMMDEVRAPEAIRILEAGGRPVRRPDLVFGTIDHTIGTRPGRDEQLAPAIAAIAGAMRAASTRHRFAFFDIGTPAQGISHVVAPESGLVLPGTTYVCSDSHASTVGALGALAFGCGTTDLAHVLATQTIALERPAAMRIRLTGSLQRGIGAKDVALYLLGRFGIHGARGHVVEYTGPVIDAMPMEQRFTLCNMAIEMGARSAIVAPDATTLAWLATRPGGIAASQSYAAQAHWSTLASDADAHFERTFDVACDDIAPHVTWGTDPSMVIAIDDVVPDPSRIDSPRREALQRALTYMGLHPGDSLCGAPVDRVFIGSCTNARLDDLGEAVRIVRGRHVAPGVRAIVVPGSTAVKRAAEARGWDVIFRDAGFEWHESGCSMCSAGSADAGLPGERCASTSNRNFEDRQGRGVRTHLVSPTMAAAAAVRGRFVDARSFGP